MINSKGRPLLWLGVTLTVAGAVICRVSLRERAAPRPEAAGPASS